MTDTETKLISINAALAERAERLAFLEGMGPLKPMTARPLAIESVKSQIRDLENEKHALLQTLKP